MQRNIQKLYARWRNSKVLIALMAAIALVLTSGALVASHDTETNSADGEVNIVQDAVPAESSVALVARAEIRRELFTNELNVLRKSKDRVGFDEKDVSGYAIVVLPSDFPFGTFVSTMTMTTANSHNGAHMREVSTTADNGLTRGIETDSRVVDLATADGVIDTVTAAISHHAFSNDANVVGPNGVLHGINSQAPLTGSASAYSSSITGPNTIPVSAGNAYLFPAFITGGFGSVSRLGDGFVSA